MKRLVKFDIGGVPYVNTDFTEVLQNEHIKCYGGLLDSMNQNTYSNRNSGIILKGCKLINASNSDFTINFYDSMIYLNGEFYQYDSNSQDDEIIPYTTFYLYPSATSSQTRYLRDLTTSVDVIETAYFTWSNIQPPSGEFIEFSNKGTSRYFKRIYKYFTSRSGDIYITSSTSSFSATGLGFNDMEGFLLLNQNNTDIGPDLSGKFIKDFDNGEVFQELGSQSVALTLPQLASHTHSVSATTYSMNHLHMMNTSMYHWPWLRGQWHDPYPQAKPIANTRPYSADNPNFISEVQPWVDDHSIGGDGTQDLVRLDHQGIETITGSLSWANTTNNGAKCNTNFMRTSNSDIRRTSGVNAISNGVIHLSPNAPAYYYLDKDSNSWSYQTGAKRIGVNWTPSDGDLTSWGRGTTNDVASGDSRGLTIYNNITQQTLPTGFFYFKNTLNETRTLVFSWTQHTVKCGWWKWNLISPLTPLNNPNARTRITFELVKCSATGNFITANQIVLSTSPQIGHTKTSNKFVQSQYQTDWTIESGSQTLTLGPNEFFMVYYRHFQGTPVSSGSTDPINQQFGVAIRVPPGSGVNVTLTETKPETQADVVESPTKIDYYTYGISNPNRGDNLQFGTNNEIFNLPGNNNFATHSHTFSSGTYSGTGILGTDGLPHDNRPEYKVMAFYTKKYDFTWRG